MSDKKTFDDIINSGKPVLVDFFAEWCSPCKMMKPILENLKNLVGSKADIIKIDVDKNQSMSKKLDIRGVPTLAIFKNGKIVWRKSGVMSADQLHELINKYI